MVTSNLEMFVGVAKKLQLARPGLTLSERPRHAYDVGDGAINVERTGDASALVRAAARTHAS